MKDKEKRKIDREVLSLVLLHLKVLNMEASKKNIKMATVMFIAGVQYIDEIYREVRNLKNKNAKTS